MSKVRSERIGRFYHYYPAVSVVVTAQARDHTNAMAVAWNFPLSVDPPLYGVAISPRRFTHSLIQESREFVVNFLPMRQAELLAAVGGTSGISLDKFERFKIETEPPLRIKAPILKDAYTSYECRVINEVKAGDHDLFIGLIVAIHYAEEAFEENGTLKLSQVTPTLYLGSDTYLVVEKGQVRRLDREVYAAEYGGIPSFQ